MVIKMLTELKRRMNELTENFNKVIEKHKNEPNNTVTKTNNILQGINSRLEDGEAWIRDLEDRIVEITQLAQKKKKN